MKLFIIHTDTDAGSEIYHFYTEQEANTFALEWCKERLPDDTDMTKFNDWREAYEAVQIPDNMDFEWITYEQIDLEPEKLLAGLSIQDLRDLAGQCDALANAKDDAAA